MDFTYDNCEMFVKHEAKNNCRSFFTLDIVPMIYYYIRVFNAIKDKLI